MNERLKAYRRGYRAEFLAAWYLRFKGYRILSNRFKTKQGEIDIIARKGNLVIMVEVKARKTVHEAADAVGWHSQRRIHDAADIWLSKQKDAIKLSLRFDIIAILPRKWPVHLADAF